MEYCITLPIADSVSSVTLATNSVFELSLCNLDGFHRPIVDDTLKISFEPYPHNVESAHFCQLEAANGPQLVGSIPKAVSKSGFTDMLAQSRDCISTMRKAVQDSNARGIWITIDKTCGWYAPAISFLMKEEVYAVELPGMKYDKSLNSIAITFSDRDHIDYLFSRLR